MDLWYYFSCHCIFIGDYNFDWRVFHSSVCIGDTVFVWGGVQKKLPFIHDDPLKRQLTSSVETFNLLTSSWEKKQTTDTPHNGAIRYSCSSIGDNIYFFGGCCNINECYHNDLYVLNSVTRKWTEVVCSDPKPMKKAGSGMISLSFGGEDYLLVIGGLGSVPAKAPVHFHHTHFSVSSSIFHTDEIHMMCVSSFPGNV